MYDILKTKTYKHDYEKLQEYLQVLRRYLFFQRDAIEANRKESTADKDNFDLSLAVLSSMGIDTIIESVPKSYEKKAKSLIDYWKTKHNERIKWDDTGRIYLDGKPIENSNIIDIVNDFIRKRKTAQPAVGRDGIARIMGASSTPKKLIGNDEILALLPREDLNNSSINKGDDDDDDDERPLKKKKDGKTSWLRLY